MSNNEEKEYDYNYVVKTIDSCTHFGHLETVNTMIDLFNTKWKPKYSQCDLPETIELRGVLKYKRKKLGQLGIIIP